MKLDYVVTTRRAGASQTTKHFPEALAKDLYIKALRELEPQHPEPRVEMRLTQEG